MSEARERAADRCDELAERLEVAARHLRRTAAHFRADDVPRACAHLVAAGGELVDVRRGLDDLAAEHARRAAP